jgi:methylated-DNA-protein-cysteine methyltransferase-like protein
MLVQPKDQLSFDLSVWEVVKEIPYGRVATYGQIAGILGPPGEVDDATYRAFGARWVGAAMARCPNEVPWHRVINSQGKISERAVSAVQRQRENLEAEGVTFDAHGRVDLKTFQWRPDQ